jgi:signal transduction histidine kinase
METKRILIVDDEEKVVFFLREALAGSSDHYEVVGVRSGAEALQQIRIQKFDLVITDQRMSGMQGLELLEQIREHSPTTRLVLMTAYGTEEVQEAARRLQVTHFFNKPFRVQELIDVVQHALGATTVNRLGAVQLSADTQASLQQTLAALNADLGAQYALLTDTTAQIIATVGEMRGLDVMTLATLLAGNFITNGQLATRLQQNSRFQLNCYEGETMDIVSAGVTEQALLAVIFAPPRLDTTSQEKVVRAIKQAAQNLRAILKAALVSVAETLPSPLANASPPLVTGTTAAKAGSAPVIGTAMPTPTKPAHEVASPKGALAQTDVEAVYKLLALEASRERHRLAREIHDGPTQIFVNSIFEVGFIEEMLERNPSQLKAELVSLKEKFKHGLEEMRRFMFDLRLPVLDAMTLPEALGWLCADFQKRTKVEVLLNADAIQGRLPSHVEGTILRIVQEALHNIQKHARATLVTVSAQRDASGLTVLIADNGKGFSMQTGSKESGVGLGSMDERAQMIKGKLKIESAPGKGTRIWLNVPAEVVG